MPDLGRWVAATLAKCYDMLCTHYANTLGSLSKGSCYSRVGPCQFIYIFQVLLSMPINEQGSGLDTMITVCFCKIIWRRGKDLLSHKAGFQVDRSQTLVSLLRMHLEPTIHSNVETSGLYCAMRRNL